MEQQPTQETTSGDVGFVASRGSGNDEPSKSNTPLEKKARVDSEHDIIGEEDGTPEDSNNQEAMSLSSVSISQQFEWTGLGRRSNKEKATSAATKTDQESDDCLWLDDLLLWNVLGFAVDIGPDYLKFQCVCKRWKSIVNLLVPPVILKMSSLLEEPLIPLEEGSLLWRQALASCKSRHCPLYRTVEEDSQNLWPTLQPQFNVVLMRFVHHLSCQRSPHSGSRVLYESILTFLAELSNDSVHKFWSIMKAKPLLKGGRLLQLEELISAWCEWTGVVETVEGLANYLNRYFVKHNDLPSISKAAERNLIQSWRTSLSSKVSKKDCAAVQAFITNYGNEHVIQSLSLHERGLLSEALMVCKTLQEMSQEQPENEQSPEQWVAVGESFTWIEPSLSSFLKSSSTDAAATDPQQPKERDDEQSPIIIQCPGGHSYPISTSSHFLKSSGFLGRLRLRAGDVIRLHIQPAPMVKVLEFYAMDAINPLPRIPVPLAQDLEEIVGESYARFTLFLPGTELVDLINAANLLDCKTLLEFTCAAMANMIRGKSTEEMRQILNIENDFTPEEEAQVREENRWFEEA